MFDPILVLGAALFYGSVHLWVAFEGMRVREVAAKKRLQDTITRLTPLAIRARQVERQAAGLSRLVREAMDADACLIDAAEQVVGAAGRLRINIEIVDQKARNPKEIVEKTDDAAGAG